MGKIKSKGETFSGAFFCHPEEEKSNVGSLGFAWGGLRGDARFQCLFLPPAGRGAIQFGEVGIRNITLNDGSRTYCGSV